MPRGYERSANSNKVDGVRVSRTTYYAQLEDDVEPFTYNSQKASNNDDILDVADDFKPENLPKIEKNINTAQFADDIKVLAEHNKEIEEQIA